MAILVDRETRLLVQGMTGRAGTFYTDLAMDYGTKVVAGVRPGKGGRRHLGVPIFDRVAEVPLAVCVTERVPILDMVLVREALAGSPTRLVGPNSQGVLSPGKCKVGVMSTADARPGPIGVVSRSASLTSEIVAQISAAGLGQSTTVGIGADPLHGIGFVDCLRLFLADEETQGIVLIGEIGGTEEEATAEFLRRENPAKPVVALIAGRHAPQLRRMGHAGAFTDAGRGQAEAKIEALRSAGAWIAEDADRVAEMMLKALRERT